MNESYYGFKQINKKSPAELITKLSKEQLEINCEENCAICVEPHKKGDTIMTECNHEFGKICFSFWVNCCQKPCLNKICWENSCQKITCPICRADCKIITSFHRL
jgi:hypothetical protein